MIEGEEEFIPYPFDEKKAKNQKNEVKHGGRPV